MRVLLAVGSAPCLHQDVEAALALHPDAELMLINGACASIERAGHMLAGHTEKAEDFAAARKLAFPHADPIRVHANWKSKQPIPWKQYPSVTDWWGPDVSTGATSAGKAARIGFHMGFQKIILCGCPLDGSGYSFDEAQVAHDCLRVGAPETQEAKVIQRYRATMARLAAGDFKGRVFSVSGFTAQVLGYPPGWRV